MVGVTAFVRVAAVMAVEVLYLSVCCVGLLVLVVVVGRTRATTTIITTTTSGHC